jgi:hypothetical protein
MAPFRRNEEVVHRMIQRLAEATHKKKQKLKKAAEVFLF